MSLSSKQRCIVLKVGDVVSLSIHLLLIMVYVHRIILLVRWAITIQSIFGAVAADSTTSNQNIDTFFDSISYSEIQGLYTILRSHSFYTIGTCL
jgi:hypothetical protein